MMRRLSAITAFGALVAWPLLAAANESLDAFFPQSSIVIESEQACYRFTVHVAVNDAQRARGLMHVRSMDPWHGMLFVYSSDAEHSMWMKNTFIPLDMLFIRGDGSVARIAENTEPQSLVSISSREPVRYVLELNGGTSEALGITTNSTVLWSGDLAPPRR